MRVAIPKEIAKGEGRVSAIAETVDKMVKAGLTVSVESDAGKAACVSDADYEKVGARIIPDVVSLLSDADIVLKVGRPLFNEKEGRHEIDMMKEGSVLVSLLYPDFPLLQKLTSKKIAAFSLEMIPRITRAQRMDVLSSMSSIAGYKAVLLGAVSFGKFLPMMTTAAGTLPPAKVLILGAGVAGLQAIATAKRLGGVVSAFDTRPAVKEQVQSLGAEFVELDLGQEQTEDAGGYAKALSAEFHRKEKELIHQHLKASDMVITTALIPGKTAPVLITAEMVKEMKKGSVIVDLAVEQGGNCELSQVDQTVIEHGVVIVGATNLPGSVPIHGSQMFAKNLFNFLSLFYVNKEIKIDLNDEIIRGALVTYQGEVIHPKVKESYSKGGVS